MSSKMLLVGSLATALAATAFGCSSLPTNTTEAQQPMSVIDQAQFGPQADRQVQSIADLKANLPARISEADAATMLVEIDPSKVVSGNYSVQQFRGRYGG